MEVIIKQELKQLKVVDGSVLMKRRYGIGGPIISYLCKMRKREGSNPSRILYVYIIWNVHIYLTKVLYN